MQIKKDWEHIGNIEKETKLFKVLDKLNIDWKQSGQGDFTPQHTLFNCIIRDNKNNYYNFTYQCNTRYTQPTETSLLSCLISDAFCYSDCVVGDDDDNIEEFSIMFGYDDNVKQLLKAYRGCKEAYYNIKKMLSDEEIETIREYLEEVGEF